MLMDRYYSTIKMIHGFRITAVIAPDYELHAISERNQGACNRRLQARHQRRALFPNMLLVGHFRREHRRLPKYDQTRLGHNKAAGLRDEP